MVLEGGGVSGGVGVPGGEPSTLCCSPLCWPSDAGCVGGLACDGGSGGGWLGAWIGGWLLEWRRGVAHGWETGEVGEVGEWLDRGLGVGLRDWDEPEEEAWFTELQGWLGGGFVGLGGAGACFLVPLRIICGLGPMDPAPGVPLPSCPAVWPPPPEPFLWSTGVGAGVESRSFGLLSSSVCWARSC